MTNPTTIWLVRHGHVHNPRGIIYGRLPRFRLSVRGLDEARAAGRAMAELPISAAYTSPLLRARQTAAEILAHHPGVPLRRTPLLLEVLTIFEGRDGLEGDRRGGDYYTGVGPPFEQPQDILARVRQFFATVRRRYAGREVVAVTHGDVVIFTLIWARGAPVTAQSKVEFHKLGYGGYPATASFTAFTFRTDSPDEVPEVDYRHAPVGG
ncbi:MAG: histidine phosphatase family protein [Gammaproteobacteria bacterium]|nr:histidine phosphatase family protein [Gammaproteobacteria bacterium]